MRILLGHTFPESATFGPCWIDSWLARLRAAGFEVYPFSLVFDQLRPVKYFHELDILWRYRDRRLLAMYQDLETTLLDYDVFICFNGANVHPEFVLSLGCFTVYGCFDDPEASERLSKPVAAAFDLAMVGNIAEVDTYRSWGVQNVRWWPLGFREDDCDPSLTEQEILEGQRDVEVALLCERLTRYRKNRLDRFVQAFPNGTYYGKGWSSGFLSESQRITLLQQTRIGINIHNSTGPINFRTFYLPANGVMQICDNKDFLGRIFALETEVIGYDSIDEAIDLTRYYLDHDAERRRIAAAGWKRVINDYNEVICFERVVDAISDLNCGNTDKERRQELVVDLSGRDRWLQQFVNGVMLAIWGASYTLGRKIRALIRKARMNDYG